MSKIAFSTRTLSSYAIFTFSPFSVIKGKFKHRIVVARRKKLRQLVKHHLNRPKRSVFSLQDQTFGNITQELKKIETSDYATTARTHCPVSKLQGHQIKRNILKYARTILLGQLDKKNKQPVIDDDGKHKKAKVTEGQFREAKNQMVVLGQLPLSFFESVA